MTKISRSELDEAEGQRWTEIIGFTINMEQRATWWSACSGRGGQEDQEGAAVLACRAAGDQRDARPPGGQPALAMSVFLTSNVRDAQKLLEEKNRFRELELAYAATHLNRLAENTIQSIRDQLAAHRHHQRPEAHQFAAVLGGLPGARGQQRRWPRCARRPRCPARRTTGWAYAYPAVEGGQHQGGLGREGALRQARLHLAVRQQIEALDLAVLVVGVAPASGTVARNQWMRSPCSPRRRPRGWAGQTAPARRRSRDSWPRRRPASSQVSRASGCVQACRRPTPCRPSACPTCPGCWPCCGALLHPHGGRRRAQPTRCTARVARPSTRTAPRSTVARRRPCGGAHGQLLVAPGATAARRRAGPAPGHSARAWHRRRHRVPRRGRLHTH